MMNEHTAKAFDVDLQELSRMVAEMGGLAEKQIADAIGALARRDAERGKRVIEVDARIDDLQHEIEDKAVLTIARRQPMAVDLREIVGALRVANDLERIGDLAKNIAKRVSRSTGDFRPHKLIRGVEHMAAMVLGQLKQVLDSYASHDLAKALDRVEGRRGDRRHVHLAVPRADDLHDGRSAQHHLLHAPHVHRQEYRAHGRSRYQYRRDGLFHDRGARDRRPASEGRHHDLAGVGELRSPSG